jgi:hypothetical protein
VVALVDGLVHALCVGCCRSGRGDHYASGHHGQQQRESTDDTTEHGNSSGSWYERTCRKTAVIIVKEQ